MAEAAPADDAAPSPARAHEAHPELDIPKLHALPSEQQDLYTLTFSSDLLRHVSALSNEDASAHQMYVKKELFKLLTLPSPNPTRIIRHNLGRTFALIFEKSDRKLLFESVNELIGLIGASGRTEKDIRIKHAAAHCLGALFESAGDSAISLAPAASAALLKLLKQAANHAGFRATVFRSLGLVFKGIGHGADESAAKDVWKASRAAAASDKSLLVQKNACFTMEQLVTSTGFYNNNNDFEKLCTAVWKAIDSSSATVRHAAAAALSAALVKSYDDDPMSNKEPVPKLKKPKRRQTALQDEGDEADLPERSGSPVPTKPVTQLAFGLQDMLKQLSAHYCRSGTSNRTRAGIAVCYIKVIKALPASIVESKYGDIATHLFNDLLSHSVITSNRYRLLITRKFVRIILETAIGRQVLGESGQLNATKFLVNDILKDYPQALKERPEPSKQALVGALSALTSLFKNLGSATQSIAETCREGLLQVLQHPSYTVQIYASSALRAFTLACPQQLLPCVTICMNSVNRELSLLAGPRQSPRRCVGFANGLSAVLSTSPLQPLYGSVDVNSRVLSQATGLLKSSGSSDLRISSTQIQVAWILIGGLMTLGPNFVKIHLSQLLLLWKNALPKPLNKDNMVSRNLLELSFLAHVRECALGSILTFLEFNERLLTLDVTKRLAAMLQNTTSFLNSLPTKKTTDDITQRLSPALQLQDFDLMVRRRVLQCYTRLLNSSPTGSGEVLQQTNLLPFTVACFADPDNYTPSSLSTSIASSAGAFESIWDVGDNYGFGVTGLVNGFDVTPVPGEHETSSRRHWISKTGPTASVDQTLLSPICGAREHDSITLYVTATDPSREYSYPASTEVVNAAIHLFAISLPLQTPKVQESILEQLSSFLSSNSLQRDPSRKAAMVVNVSIALLDALKVTLKETQSAAGDLKGPAVEKVMQDLLRSFIVSPDPYVRHVASEALGRLCRSSGNNFTTSEVNYLMDQIVSNREPNVRAGCALALGCIHAQLGGMAAGYHLKNILGILMSLGNDPHPTVHFWALESLSKVADSAGLTYSSYVTSTLGMLAQLYVSETHHEECASLASSNLEVDTPSIAVIARCTDSTINVLGPDLQDMAKVRDMITTLINRFQDESEELILIESLRCMEHLSLYASGHMDFALYVRRLQRDLQSSSVQIRDMAIDGLHNLMRKNAEEVIRTAEPGLEDQLWQVFNDVPEHEVIRNIINNWLGQTSLSKTGQWVQRCHLILSRATRRTGQAAPKTEAKQAGGPDLQDEEVAGFAASAGQGNEDGAAVSGSSQELLRWQVRTFAMDCLSKLLAVVGKEAALREDSPSVLAMQQKIADVVRIAFSASTAGVIQLRIRGLKIIDQVLKIFGKTPDPEFPEASLLEQYQAQIGSALTPAFAADSSPELAAEAVNICATFIATGIVTDVDRMGRILKLLVSSLENFSNDTETASIGDLKGLSSNAQVMVKMAVFSAWAELQIASAEQKYLVDVLRPHLAKLTPLWLASLREYARLRFEPDISTNAGPASLSGNLDTIYAALNRETLLKFYQDSWLNLVDAIASLIDEDSEFVFDALDGKTELDEPTGSTDKAPNDINYRDEPVAFFFVLFGLAFEALVSRTGDSQASKEQTLEILQALKKILRPSVSGHAIYQEVVFSETMDLLDRLVLTEGLAVQSVIVEIARNLCLGHPSARSSEDSTEEDRLSDDLEQLFELTRIMVLVLAGLVPNLTDNTSQVSARHELTDEAVTLLSLALSSLTEVAAVFPSIIKTDLHACILHIFITIFATGTCQSTVVPQALPVFRRFIGGIARPTPSIETSTQLRATVVRLLAILKHAQKREFDAALVCEKNTIMALTIMFSTAGPAFTPADPLLPRFTEDLADCLSNRMTSKVAASCCRSLLLLPAKGPADNALAAHLLPRLLNFLANPEDVEGLDESRTLIAHTLTSWLGTLTPQEAGIAMALIIPALLTRASKEGQNTWGETSTRLLECAGVDQTAFREVVARLDATQKALMEGVVKAGGAAAAAAEKRRNVAIKEQGGGEPSIALKMDF